MNGMKNTRNNATEDFYQYLVSCMVLINLVVNGPDDLRVRSLLRNEFFQLGLEGILKVGFPLILTLKYCRNFRK